jgi:2-polyprenyl-3-methyl-5-hydroxy-6-metoxy-1,4-benzoquinol methylase
LNYSGRRFGIINGIAVFHHITDDEEWKESIRACLLLLKPGGLLFISSQFVDSAAADYKKYRSLNRWLSSSVEVVDLIKSKEPPGIKNHDDLLILRKNEL